MAENKISYEQAVKSLEEIVKRLESGEALLDESLALYEQAVKLTDICNKYIKEAEKKISVLVKGQDGNIEKQDFEVQGE